MNYCIIKPGNTLSSDNANLLRQEIAELTKQHRLILIDFADVTDVADASLDVLVSAQEVIRFTRSQIFICGLSTKLQVQFELRSVDRAFQSFPTREAFEKTIVGVR